jgi:hypothetical protein
MNRGAKKKTVWKYSVDCGIGKITPGLQMTKIPPKMQHVHMLKRRRNITTSLQ